MNYTTEDHVRERAICDRAAAYAQQFRQKNGWIVIPAEAAKHPEYAACDNAMRGRVERYELLRDLPDRFIAYFTAPGGVGRVTTWPGDELGKAWITGTAPARGHYAARTDRRHYGRAVIRGKHYAWTGAGEGMACRLRALKHQPTRTP